MKSKCISLILAIIAFGCSKDDEGTVNPNSLEQFISQNGLEVVREKLIACAAGGQSGFLDEPSESTSILFYPEGAASDFKYFESKGVNINPENFREYEQVDLSQSPLFNGYLRRFILPDPSSEKWCLITYLKDGKLHISDPIRLKTAVSPSEYNAELLTIDQETVTSPKFSWSDGLIAENVIYFHVVSDDQGNLISGTYTQDKFFQFYDLSNVVLNIRDISPAPMLKKDMNYNFTLMGVSDDNWVNLIVSRQFNTF